MRSLRSKFSFVIAVVLILTLGVSGYFLIQNNITVLTAKLQQDAINFADFSSSPISESYESQYKTGNFIGHSQYISQTMRRNTDITKIRIISKENGILYDSLVEKDKVYDGPSRRITDKRVLSRLLDVKPSFELMSGELVFLLKDSTGMYQAVDKNGKRLDESIEDERVKNLVFPIPDKPFGLVFDVSYENIDQHIIDTIIRLGLFVLGSIVIGVIVSVFFVGQIVKPVERLKKGAQKIAEGDLDTQVDVTTKDEIGVLTESFNSMASDLKKNTKQLVEKERLDHEINLAAQIQKDFIPKEIPSIEGIDVSASIVPATEVGGDCYDFIKKGDDLLIFIGDVTGHGVSAGLVEAITSSLVFTFAHIHEHTKDNLADMNYVINKKTRPNVFVTCVMGTWLTKDSTFRYANAGHDPVIHYKSKEGKATLLEKGSLALGMVPDIKEMIKENEIKMESGDLVVLYTDGIPEAWNGAKEQFGMDRFIKLVEQHAKLPSAQNIHDGLVQGVRMHMGEKEQEDDITLIVIKKL
jgi:serine phosphatase RsbU (regulator of sigma subunit)